MESLSPYEMTHRAFGEANLALRRLNEMLEESAKRIAHALHDEAGQLLVPAHLALAEVADVLTGPHRERVQEIRGILYEIERQLRQLSHELRPVVLDDLGIVPAVEFLARGVSERTGLIIQVEGSTQGRLPSQIETALYRIVQEALTNVGKHAQATRVRICLEQEYGKVCCIIRDDGRGFNKSSVLETRGQQGLGLRGIRERLNAVDGRLQITSAPNQGTELAVMIPLEA